MNNLDVTRINDEVAMFNEMKPYANPSAQSMRRDYYIP